MTSEINGFRFGPSRIVICEGQRVVSQRVAGKHNGLIYRGIIFDDLKELGGPVRLPYFTVCRLQPESRTETPFFRISAAAETPRVLAYDRININDRINLRPAPWITNNYPPVRSFSTDGDFETGFPPVLLMVKTNSPDFMLDLVLIVRFLFKWQANPNARITIGIPLGCRVVKQETRGKDFNYFLFAPERQSQITGYFPAYRHVFTGMPRRIFLAMGLAQAEMQYREEAECYVATSFSAAPFARFPSLPIPDLKRVRVRSDR